MAKCAVTCLGVVLPRGSEIAFYNSDLLYCMRWLHDTLVPKEITILFLGFVIYCIEQKEEHSII